MPSSAYNKFNLTVEDWLKAGCNFSTDTFKVMLTNTAPVATNNVKSDIIEIAAGNGYTAGGATTTVSLSNSGGTETVTATPVTFTATGAGSIGPFRYPVLYDATTNFLICYFDYGVAVTLNGVSSDSSTITFGSGANQLFTLV